MSEFDSFKALFSQICEIKQFVVKLSCKDLKNYKIVFYNQEFPKWRLDLIWEYFWNDVDYETMIYIFKNNKII